MHTNSPVISVEHGGPPVMNYNDGEKNNQPPGSIDLRSARIAEHLGDKITEVEQLPFDLSALDNDGLFINMDGISYKNRLNLTAYKSTT